MKLVCKVYPFFVFVFIFGSGLGLFAQAQTKQPDSLIIKVTKLDVVNSGFGDYAPVISADGLTMLFTSRRPVTESEIKKNKKSKENIYMSSYDPKEKKWAEPKILGESVNEPGRNNSAIALSNDGHTMIFFRDDMYGNGDIYESHLNGDTWSEGVILPEPVTSDGHESSASFSPDERTLYFVSNRKGGKGGRDIWSCTRDSEGKWGKAKNLAALNTKGDEEGVFMHPDGKTLYFSSNGLQGQGGYDVFKSVLENGKWTTPVNLGPPISTPGNDLYFVVSANGKHGFYSISTKAEKNVEQDPGDIYEVIITEDTTTQLTLVKGTVTDQNNNFLSATIKIFNDETGELISTQESNSFSGKFLLSLPSGKNYRVEYSAPGYKSRTEHFNIPKGARYKEITTNIVLEPGAISLKGKVVDENGNPISSATLEITDNASGTVIGKASIASGVITYELMGGKNMGNIGIAVNAPDHLFYSTKPVFPPNATSLDLGTIVLPTIKQGNKMTLNNLFFDFGKSSLRSDSKSELERLVRILKENPSMKIEISGHTDNKGSKDLNLKLSDNRAKAVVSFLTANGIEHARLKAVGYGDKFPVGDNKTEAGRQLNRRTEFKILDVDKNATPVVIQQPNNSKIPQDLKIADFNNDGNISAKEIDKAIDLFFDGNPKLKLQTINKLIDFFFEQ